MNDQKQTNHRYWKHPESLVESNAIGNDTRIWAFSHVMEGASIGRQCNVGEHVFVETGSIVGDRVTIKNGVQIWEGVTIQDDAFIGPNVTFCNDRFPRSPRAEWVRHRYKSKAWVEETRVGRGATIGANATIVCGIEIGPFAMIGAAGLVTRRVPAFGLVAGVPARIKGYVCYCGLPLKPNRMNTGILSCKKCEIDYRLQNDRLHPNQESPKNSHMHG